MRRVATLRRPAAVAALCVWIALVAGGCAPLPPPGPAAPGIAIENAYARPASAGGNGGAFMTVVNHAAQADRLLAARSPASPTMEIHETTNDGGVMKMRPVPAGFEVPAQGRLELKPGGKHLMFIGLTSALAEGSEVELTLVFEKAGEIKVKAPIKQQ